MVGKPVFGVSYVVKPKRTINGKLTRWPHDFTPSCLSKRSENTSTRRPDRERSRPHGSRRPQSRHDPDCVTRCVGRVLCTHAVGAAPRGGRAGCRYDMVRTHFYQSRGKATPQRQEATAGSETGGAPGRVRRGTKEPSSGDGRVLRLGLAGGWHDSGLCTHLSKLTEHKRVNSFSF